MYVRSMCTYVSVHVGSLKQKKGDGGSAEIPPMREGGMQAGRGGWGPAGGRWWAQGAVGERDD